ncbi:MAG: polymerase alpha subunit [Proteobacteria bacterium]|nr:polymerase alpha subunit [Pseudomonadota bacterium]
MKLPDYAELHCLSNFSFLRGASHADELVGRAKELGYCALAITDECSFAGVVRAHVAAKQAGLKLLIGSELVLTDGIKLVLLAQDRAGYGNLCAIITLARRRAAKGSYRLGHHDLVRGVPGCLALWIAGAQATPDDAGWLRDAFPGHAWIAFERHLQPDDKRRLAALRELSAQSGLPLVACGDVHMHARARRPLQDVLTALRRKTSVDDAGGALFANGERHLRSRLRLARLYPPELLAQTLRIADLCNFSLDELRYEYPQDDVVPAGQTPAAYLKAEVDQGLAVRYPSGTPAKVRQQIAYELALIEQMNYEAYFLTVYDIVKFARAHKILCQGRGSAANSAVCYALGITEVDPAHSEMLFERFISKERNEPPDIDVDFEHQRREQVIQYIYAKYGRERAALTAAVISYRTRSALRDCGRALSIDSDRIDALTSSLAWWDDPDQLAERFAEVGLDANSPRVEKWLILSKQLIGFPRHLSQHVGGFVISRGRLDRLVPIENAAMAERSIIEWDKDDIDALGLMKVDVLALGMLSAIRRALDSISARDDRAFRMQDIPRDDPAVFAMISRADTVGVFQIESRAQMAMLPRLKPCCFYDLVIEVAIVRPGPIQGGMVHPYLRRRQGLEPVSYPSPEVESVLQRTLGVPIFQEQVMQLAIVAAGFSPGEADHLRRSMAAWKRRGGVGHLRERLITGMLERNYSREFAESLFRQIEGFGEYGFPESHAASFALLVYVSAWLKHHEPAAFLAGLLNSQPMGFYSSSQLVQDARRHRIEIKPPDVQHSDWPSSLAGSSALRLGLRQISGLGRDAGQRIAAARPFIDVADLARRATLSRDDLDQLAAGGALATLAGHRRQAAWATAAVPLQRDLLREASASETVIALPAPSEGEDLVADYASLQLTLGRHPLKLLRALLEARRYVTAATLRAYGNHRVARCAGIVTGRQRPGSASGVVFLTLEDESGLINVIVHPKLAERQRRELLSAKLLGVFGVLQREGEVVHLIAKRLVDHSDLLGRLPTSSRDFH